MVWRPPARSFQFLTAVAIVFVIAADIIKHLPVIVASLLSYALYVGLAWWAEHLVEAEIAKAQEFARINTDLHVIEDDI